MAWWQLPVVAVAVVALDRLALAAETRGWLYWRRSQGGGSGGGSGALGELIEVFQPSRSSTVAETERRRLDIVQRGVEGPPFGVDLDAGVAYVPRSVDGVSRPDYRASMGLVVSNLSVDCAEPRALASWWAEALGWQVIEDPDLEDGADDEVGIEPTDRSARWGPGGPTSGKVRTCPGSCSPIPRATSSACCGAKRPSSTRNRPARSRTPVTRLSG